MKQNVQKSYSRRGAAMLIALLVFFLAALSGTIALTMAASNAGRYTHEKDDQQAYLSVVSAANLILDRLTGIEIVCTAKSGDPEPKEVTVTVNTEKKDLFLNDVNFTTYLQTYVSQKATLDPIEFTLSSKDAPEMGVVCVNVSVSGGTFFFRLYSVDGSHRDYQMTMKIDIENTYGGGNWMENPEALREEEKYKRGMKFNTAGATYTVEGNVSSGGTTE